ncbi:unnamed protein product [[Candida] boidinii]|nr:unnamed protein product [[Candida] boidinii]
MVGNGTKSANHEITNSSVESLGESISSDLNFENNNNKIIVSLPIYKFQISEILFNYISLFDETATTASEAKPLGQESRNENGKSATSYRDIDIDWISDDSIALKLKGEIIFVQKSHGTADAEDTEDNRRLQTQNEGCGASESNTAGLCPAASADYAPAGNNGQRCPGAWLNADTPYTACNTHSVIESRQRTQDTARSTPTNRTARRTATSFMHSEKGAGRRKNWLLSMKIASLVIAIY